MNLLLVVDHLGLGGAQRQVVELACGLKERGHRVEIFVYFPKYRFFRPRLEERQIVVHEYDKGRGFSAGVLRHLHALRSSGGFDVLVSYLNNPNIYAELASVTGGPKLIVSERCSHHDDRSRLVGSARRLLHVLSDFIVTNSRTHAQWLGRKWWLKGKVACIYNGIDLDMPAAVRTAPRRPADLRLLAVGRICPQKNVTGLIEALGLYYREHGYVPQISWAGKREGGREGRVYARRVEDLLASVPEVGRRWHWLGEEPDMQRLLRDHDVLIHPSLYEGLPNAVCEALAAGMPALVSNVCDHALLVADNERGFTFDPCEPRSIADAISKIARLSAAQWRDFSTNARTYAEENLGNGRMVNAYESLCMRLTE